MKDIRKTEITVGVTVFTALIIVLAVVYWARNVNFGSDDIKLSIKFDSVAGLETGDAVTVNGVKKGFVKDIDVYGSDAIVKISINPEIDLREDAKFSVMMLDLMGGKKIEVDPGKSHNKIDYSVIQTGKFAGDISTAMAVLSSVENEFVAVIKDVQITLEKLNQIFVDSTFSVDLKSALSNFNSTTANLNQILTENRSALKELISSSGELIESSNRVISTNEGQITKVLNEAFTALENSKKLILEFESFAGDVKDKKNTIGKILYDDELLENLKKTMSKTDELINLLLKQLKGKGINVKADVDLF